MFLTVTCHTGNQVLGSTLKFERANKHFMDTEAAVVQFLASKPYRITQDFESEPGKFRFWVTLLEEPPSVISLAAGDTVHNMRSALDHIVYEISSKQVVNPSGTAFPIQTKEDDWDKRDKKDTIQRGSGLHQVRYLPDSAQTLIQNLQPCPRPEMFEPDMFGPNRERLRELHDFDIADKHKNLNLAVTYAQHASVGHNEVSASFPNFEYVHRGPLKLDTPTLLLQLSAVPQMDVQPILALGITFSDGRSAGEPVGACLRELLVCVEMILNALRSFV